MFQDDKIDERQNLTVLGPRRGACLPIATGQVVRLSKRSTNETYTTERLQIHNKESAALCGELCTDHTNLSEHLADQSPFDTNDSPCTYALHHISVHQEEGH